MGAAEVLQKRIPRLLTVSLDSIDLGCMYGPKKCNPDDVKSPSIKVCFTEVGCETRKFPGMMEMLSALETAARNRMVLWLGKVLKFEKDVLRFPALVNMKTTATRDSVIQSPQSL